MSKNISHDFWTAIAGYLLKKAPHFFIPLIINIIDIQIPSFASFVLYLLSKTSRTVTYYDQVKNVRTFALFKKSSSKNLLFLVTVIFWFFSAENQCFKNTTHTRRDKLHVKSMSERKTSSSAVFDCNSFTSQRTNNYDDLSFKKWKAWNIGLTSNQLFWLAQLCAVITFLSKKLYEKYVMLVCTYVIHT